MELLHSFTVPAPVGEAWALLLDVERIVPALPGASLTSFEGDSFTGQVKVKIGAIQMAYKGQGKFNERDEDARRMIMTAAGKDTKGAGTATATITCTLTEQDGSTRVNVTTDLALTGRPAQFSRGLLNDVGSKIIAQFATNISTALEEPDPVVAEPGTADVPPAVKAAPLPEAEPLDLMSVASAAVAKRAAAGVAVVAGVVLAALVVRRLRA